jgi:toxin-antitoxin system PIN domain toxin
VASIALLDVNVLVALFDPDHVHHDLAHEWFADDGRHGWATCPLTENGFVRVVSNPRYQPDAAPPSAAIDRLRTFCASGRHHFWTDQVSLRDPALFAPSGMRGHRQLTDVYLLGLARKMGGRLATFDRAIALAAVKGAKRSHLAIIEPG